MKGLTLLTLATIFSGYVAASNVGMTGKLQFSGVGYDSQWSPIKKITESKKKCQCDVGDPVWFSGANAPLSEPLAVHVRGPINLSKFAFYESEHFVVGDNSSENWNRTACFDNTGKSPALENVTFLGHVGKDSDCMGKALSFIGPDASTAAQVNTAPGKNVTSGAEFIIFSNTTCPKSKEKADCGVYRKGIPAYYGFGGVTKMFLFQFSMPTDGGDSIGNDTYFNQPSIWLSSDSLPRVTSEYTKDNNCSCLYQGCGGYEIFSANGTLMTSSLITLQGLNVNSTSDVASVFTNKVSDGYFRRPTNATVVGGVVFDSTGNVITFLANCTSFDQELSATSVNSMLAAIPQLGDKCEVKAGSQTAPVPKTKKAKKTKSSSMSAASSSASK